MRWGLDAAYPPPGDTLFHQKLDGWEFYCGYIGGKAAHVWTPDEWARVAGLGFDLLPIFVAPLVADPGYNLGVEDGNSAIARMLDLGLSGTVALDIESGRCPRRYSEGFLSACTAGSLGVVLYGAPATIVGIGDLPWLQWWLAWWPESPLRYDKAPPDWAMWQCADGGGCDYNVARDDFPFAGMTDPPAPAAPPTASA